MPCHGMRSLLFKQPSSMVSRESLGVCEYAESQVEFAISTLHALFIAILQPISSAEFAISMNDAHETITSTHGSILSLGQEK